MESIESGDVLVGKVRLSFAKLTKSTGKEGLNAKGEKRVKYSAALLIPKESTKEVAKIEKIITELKATFKSAYGKNPKTAPWGDGDVPNDEGVTYEEHKGNFVLNVSASKLPGVTIPLVKKNPDGSYTNLEDSEVYSGCYGYAEVRFKEYKFENTRGISCYINKFLKTNDGTSLGSGGTSVEAAFGDIEVGDEEGLLD